ncbi:MAG: hypothetical protein GY853_00275 [PVC group bacterium]|nr:hypothetical protein [PVC group bacterium]
MIKKISIGREICVSVLNEVGVLSRTTSFLVNNGINLEAVTGYARNIGEPAELMFVTNDNLAAIDILTEAGYDSVEENDVLVVELENTPGALKNISVLLSQNGLNIIYIYGTTCNKGCPAKIILATSDNRRALALLKS